MESYRIVNTVPTKLLTFGKGVGDDLLDVKHLVVVFPGNPGIIDYYRVFMKDLYVKLKNKYPKMDIPVWGISHAGHQSEGLHEFSFPHFNEHPELYSLEGQYAHKVKFLESFVPAHINVIGIGHSIGCKVWLETMKRLERNRNASQRTIAEAKKTPNLSKIFMLFPTIQKMRNTPNGENIGPYLSYFKYLIPLLRPLTLLPTFVQKWILNLYFRGREVPECAYGATMQLFNYDIVKRIAYMAKCEMEQVVDLDVPTMGENLQKLFLYFGTTDSWCPLSYVDEIKEKVPGLKYQICENGCVHAFVLENNTAMANFICNKIEIN